MKIDVLVATMNQASPLELLDSMGVNDGVIVNQVTNQSLDLPKNVTNGKKQALSMRDKGLSKSRNAALWHSNADICLLADDDVRLNEGYSETIRSAYTKYDDADIVALYIEDENKNTLRKKTRLKPGRLGLVASMKVRSVQISFKREKVVTAGVSFNENFGAGTALYMGEENIFLADCIRKGLKVYSCPEKIGILLDRESSWFNGFNEDYLRVKGTVFRAMSSRLWPLLILQFAIRKYKLFKINPLRALRIMLKSATTKQETDRIV